MSHPTDRSRRKPAQVEAPQNPDPKGIHRLLAELDVLDFEAQRHDIPQVLIKSSTVRHLRKLLRSML